jgi:dTDP-4-dehydrorhamnose 3,5-epimerase
VQITELSIEDAFEIRPVVHGDSRGYFLEWFRAEQLAAALGHPFTLAQANCSVSAAGALRGVHFSDVPPGQAKYITCAVGAVLDVIVDIRVGSPTFGRHETVLLDDETRRAVYLGEGLGHAFMALADNSVVQYLCSTPFNPDREHGIDPCDPALGIDWPTADRDGRPINLLQSAKDSSAPSLAQARTAGLLPTYAAVRRYLGSQQFEQS